MFGFKSFLFENMLLEDRISFILDKQSSKIWDAYQKDKGSGKPVEKDANGVLITLSNWSEKNLQWLTNSYIKGQYSLEDKGRVVEIIQNFEKFKRKLEKKDLNQYKSLAEIEDSLSKFSEEDAKSNKQLDREKESKFFTDKDAQLFYEGGGIKVIIPKTSEASCYFGRGTKWCTASTSSHNMFDSYSKGGKLYIVYFDDGRKYQFYFKKNLMQFMDEKDASIKDWKELTSKYPSLFDAFEKIAKKVGFLDLIKSPSEDDFKIAIKTDIFWFVHYCDQKNIVLSKEISYLFIEGNQQRISNYPKIFSKDFVLEYFSKYCDRFTWFIDWLINIKTDITKKEFNDFILEILNKPVNVHAISNFIHNIFDQLKLEKYSIFIRELPIESKIKIIKLDPDLIQFFESDLSEKIKLEMLDENPKLIDKFTNKTPKMINAAKWAKDREDRKSRGF